MTVKEWREKHKRCAYCKHCTLKLSELSRIVISPESYCRAKNKNVYLDLPRPFCSVFEAEDY